MLRCIHAEDTLLDIPHQHAIPKVADDTILDRDELGPADDNAKARQLIPGLRPDHRAFIPRRGATHTGNMLEGVSQMLITC